MSRSVCLLRGDGIAHELLPVARATLEAAAPELELLEGEIGFETFRRTRSALPLETLDRVRSAGPV